MSVWITRSAPDNLRTARALHALGLNPLMVPVIATRAIYQKPIILIPDAIIFTSVHAVRHFAWHMHMLSVPVIVSSGVVGEAALAAGYVTVTSVSGNEYAFIGLLGHLLRPSAHVMIVCGESASTTLADRLRDLAFRVERQIVYQPAPADSLEIGRVSKHLDRVTAIVLHSCGGARLIVPILQAVSWRGSLWCISDQAAQACSGLLDISVEAAAQPSEAALIQMIGQLTPRTARRKSPPSRQNTHFVQSALRNQSSSRSLESGNDNAPGESGQDDPDQGPRAA
jgi:uroporphyrinogen-III synthase